MKTSILLCALATIATAVPTNRHEAHPGQAAELENLPVSIQREKKSPLDDHHGVGLSPEVGTEDIQTHSIKSSQTMTPVEGRSLGFKKPIVIVKKKMGYHVYRDSDEELVHADPHENCRNQVKVKLCDDESGSPKSTGSCFASKRLNEDFSEKEKENGIKTTKETVENFQRGFHKTEHNPAKLATTEDKELEDDLAVHEHIEAARMALEHVQRNFGNLDTLNSQTTSPKTEDFQSKVSDEERLAQWKDAIQNIQKNFEIVRNIEDAFKADSEQTNLPSRHKDDTPKTRESEHTESSIDSQHKSNPTSLSNVELRSDGASIKPEENSDVDMFTAPTEQKELKIKLHSDSLRTEKITEESLDNHGSKTIDTTKTNENVPTMKTSENTPISEGPLKNENMKPENHQEVNDLVHNQEVKAANDINLGNENLKSLESNTHDIKMQTEKDALPEIENMTPLTADKSVDNELNLAKSANMESFDQTTNHNDHDKPVETSDVGMHHSQGEMKHSVDHELEKSKHKGDSDVTKMSLTDERPFDQSLKSKSVHEVNEHHKEEIESTNHNHQFHEHKSHGVPTPIQADTKHSEPTPIRETGFNNGQHNLNDRTLMRMIEEQNMENKMHKPNEHPITDMITTEEQSFHDFLMRWANENQQKVQEDPTTPTKMGDFNNGQHFHNALPHMRLSQDHNTEHHLSENHDQKHWAHEKQLNPSQVAKTATEFHDNMNSNQHQTMLNQVTDGHNLHELFLMRLAQEKQQNEHPKTTQDFQNEHLHEMLPQNRFANNLPNAHDMSQLGPRMNEHPHIMKQAMSSDMDSSMQPSMHVSMRGNPSMEHNDMHWNHHHHAMARYGSGLPVTSASSGAIGVFPSANSGGCGIPLMLSCSPNVISGTLAKPQPHPGTIIPSAYRSGDDLMYYMKRDAKDTDELPTLKIQKTSRPFNHKHELIFDKIQ